jgi:hypothetical protein
MAHPLRLAATALLELGMARYANGETRVTVAPLVLKLFAGVCLGAATAFAVAALFLYLTPLIGAAGAALAVAGALFASGAIAAGVGQYLSRPPRKQTLAPRPDLARPGPDLESLVAGAEGFVRDNKALALAAAFVAGILTADEMSRSRQP